MAEQIFISIGTLIGIVIILALFNELWDKIKPGEKVLRLLAWALEKIESKYRKDHG